MLPLLGGCDLFRKMAGRPTSDQIEQKRAMIEGELAAHRILPHYLFHIDPIRGVAHFATGMKKGLEIMEYFRKHLSSVATPVFALDLPEGGGKVHLFPDYSAGEEQLFFGLDGKKIRHPLA